jgi:hypothetical protein
VSSTQMWLVGVVADYTSTEGKGLTEHGAGFRDRATDPYYQQCRGNAASD